MKSKSNVMFCLKLKSCPMDLMKKFSLEIEETKVEYLPTIVIYAAWQVCLEKELFKPTLLVGSISNGWLQITFRMPSNSEDQSLWSQKVIASILSCLNFLLTLRAFSVLIPYYPSQPAVPGFEDQADTMSYLETIGKLQNKPLIGLEYVIELLDMTAKEPFYICVLCDKKCDPRNIIPQITSHRHRMKYLVRWIKVSLKKLKKKPALRNFSQFKYP